ncbi:restriction endonuclease subunit S [Shewanella baltica]|uniref:restriction endonuclease subunit S n=1 Tax=Shewanella baltica TaxID=62322 RepID=UPI0030A6C725
MSVDKMVPEIRFKGFSRDWDKNKLLNYSSKIGDGLHGTPTYTENTGVYFINGNNLVSGHIAITNDTKQVSRGEQSKTDVSLDLNTILLSINGTIGNLAWYEGQDVMLGKSVAFITLENCDNTYMYSYLQTERVKNYFSNSLTGSTIKNLGLKAIRESIILIPDERAEQTAIGNTFQKLDNLIKQHQQKHDKLSNIKKAMLEKMFPKQGKTIPEIRFKGFSGEWEEIKFSEIFNEKDGIRRGPFGGSIKKEMFVSKSDYVVYEQRNAIYDRYDTRYNISKEKYQELINFSLASGDFIMSGAGTIGRVSRVPDDVKRGVFNQAIIRMKINDERVDSEFFLQWIRSEKMQERLTESNPASAMVNLVPMSELKAWDVVVPKKDEQIVIGSYFQKLDELINQHQQQITKLNNIKQACLSKMFV